ncbi:MAG TPA: polysaccharide deacetylase family protein [Fimbriimonadaceae bacterium]|nr:polysaccharide deacetylase family protein [Fimbriimonadaceae bacterium]
MTTALTIAAPILMYHRIGATRSNSIVSGQYVPSDLFEKQLRFLLRRGYSPVSLSDFVGCLASPHKGVRPIAITFDDGYESVYTNALPILKRHNVTGTVFVVAGHVGETNDWDEAKGDVTEPMMSLEQIRDAQRLGIEIGSHTSSHPDLLQCSPPQAVDEIAGSKRLLEDLLRRPVDWFSYPYGRESEAIRSLVRAAGYLGACGTRRSLNTSRTNRYSLARINMRATTTIPWLIYKLARARGEMS